MKRWVWPMVALVLVLAWGFWPFPRASGEDASEGRVWAGWVTDAAGRPIRGAVVVVDPPGEGGTSAVLAETDKEGRFRLTDPPPGRHRLLVGQINYLPIRADGVALDPGAAPRAWVLSQTERVVEGEVRDAADAPVAWARVSYPAEVFSLEEMVAFRTRLAVRTDASGRFRIARGLRGGGTCTLRVERTGYVAAERVVDLLGETTPRQAFRLDPLPPPVLDGTVVGPDGLTSPGARLEARSGGRVVASETDDEGRFAIGGLAAGVDLLVRPSEPGRRAGFAPWRRVGIHVPSTLQVDLEMVPASERPGAVSVALETPDPLLQVEAYWVRDEAGPFEEVRIDGRRCLAYQGGISPGPVFLFLRAGDWIASQSIDVAPGETRGVALSPRPGRRARLRVRDGDGGSPVVGAVALPYVDGPRGVAFELPPATTDERGEVELCGLPEDCRVEVSAPGREPCEVLPRAREQEVRLERRR